MKGVWFLTTGLNIGASKVIGQSVSRYALLSDKPPKHTLIGLTSWACVSERTRQLLKRQVYIYIYINKININRRMSYLKIKN